MCSSFRVWQGGAGRSPHLDKILPHLIDLIINNYIANATFYIFGVCTNKRKERREKKNVLIKMKNKNINNANIFLI